MPPPFPFYCVCVLLDKLCLHHCQQCKSKDGTMEIGNFLGSGSFGTVFEGQYKGEVAAIKIVRLESCDLKDIEREIDLLRSFKHERLVRLLDLQYDKPNGPIYFVMELMQESLEHRLNGLAFDRSKRIKCLLEFSEGLAFLHDNDVIHRDLKPANLLLDSEGQLKIAGANSLCVLSITNTAIFNRSLPHPSSPHMFPSTATQTQTLDWLDTSTVV